MQHNRAWLGERMWVMIDAGMKTKAEIKSSSKSSELSTTSNKVTEQVVKACQSRVAGFVKFEADDVFFKAPKLGSRAF